MKEFRTLEAPEIECKAAVVGNMVEISLHVQAATCTKILNETVGPMNWEKVYTNGNKNCIVRIWDEDKNLFVSKEDCGGPLTEVDGHKGQASNGFKRVCALGWGLGLELYSQPKIMLPVTDDNVVYKGNNELVVSERYTLTEIEYDDRREISRCVIVGAHNNVVYDGPNEFGQSNVVPQTIEEPPLDIPDDEEQVEEDEIDTLPDNTDGFDSEIEDFMAQDTPYKSIDYRKAFDAEINRTHARRADVLKVLKISSFEELHTVSEDMLDETLRKLKALKTYGK